MKKTGALLLLMAAMLVAVPAYNTAHAAQRGGPAPAQQGYGPHHMGYAPGPGWQHPAISPEQQAAYDKVITTYRDQIQPLQNEMWAKQTELNYLSRNEKADAKTVSKMVAEMKDLRGKIQNLNNSTAAKLAKELGITTEHAYALLRGGHNGMGMGYGCGAGPRADWNGHRGGPRHR